MVSWIESAADPRSTEELFATALVESVESWDGVGGSTSALSALHARPTVDVVDAAVELLDSSDSDERLLGVAVLAELRDIDRDHAPACVDRSVAALLDRADVEFDDEVLAQIARALGYRRDPRGLSTLLQWLDHDDERVRFHVACALPTCSTTETENVVAAALIQLTRDADADVRDYALFGFPQLTIDTPEIRDAILACTADEDWSAAGQALVNLAMLGDERVIEPLINYLAANSHRPYGYEAAAAIANPALLPVLRSITPARADDLAQAINACQTGTPHRD